MTAAGPEPAVLVVGGGISGIACAREVQAAGHEVVVLDRGRRLGGRMARWTRDDRAVDVGAAYLTVRDPGFREVVDDWARRGLARPWTDTFRVADAGGDVSEARGPMRWAAEHGLRSLVEDLASGLDVRLQHDVEQVGAGPTVDGRPVRAVALAMPDPQAVDLLGDDLADLRAALHPQWLPVITVVASYPQRTWADLDGMFVHDSPVTLIVDDGRRRGDHAPVLVAHASHEAAREHLDDPDGIVPTVLAEIARRVEVPAAPVWAEAKRWGSATPAESRPEPFLLGADGVGVCGDGWSQRPRVEAAWLSGHRLGAALAARLHEG